MKCSLCGYEFNITDCKSGCAGCVMNKSCVSYKCPNCGYQEIPEPEWLKKLTGFFKKIFIKK